MQGMAGRTNFPPTIPFILLFMMLIKLGYLWNFNQINSWFSQLITTESMPYSTFIALCGFAWLVPQECNTRSCTEGQSHTM